MDIGKIHSPTPIKIDSFKPLPNIKQYPLRKEAIGIQPTVEEYIKQGLVVSCTSPCNTPIPLV